MVKYHSIVYDFNLTMREMTMDSSFGSDNFSGIHPKVLEAIGKANRGHSLAYGADDWTEQVNQLFKKIFGTSAEAFLVFNGTAANVSLLKQVLEPWQAIISPDTAHIWTDECGAVQANVGSSILPVQGYNGKIRPEQCEKYLSAKGDQHHVQPELGTVYTIEELQELSAFARRNHLLFHVDGARLSNAAASLGVSLRAITTDVGVDLLSFGGTKNGLMGVDAVVFLREGLANQFKYVRKQQLQLASKMRFLAAQMIALLENDLWLRNASHSNAMAKLLENELRNHFPEFHILYPVESNAVFVQLPSMEIMQELQKKSFFWIWNHEKLIARWMTSWDTDPSFISSFVEEIRTLQAISS